MGFPLGRGSVPSSARPPGVIIMPVEHDVDMFQLLATTFCSTVVLRYSDAMNGDDGEMALARIQAAMARIDAAAQRMSASPGDLAARHDLLRGAVAHALQQLDTLISEQGTP